LETFGLRKYRGKKEVDALRKKERKRDRVLQLKDAGGIPGEGRRIRML